MPFTIHPDQKPSDDEAYWKRYIELHGDPYETEQPDN